MENLTTPGISIRRTVEKKIQCKSFLDSPWKRKNNMNVEQVELIRQSLIQVHPIADQIARSFYAHLFEVTPHLRNLFPGDMNRQGAMLMTSLELAVSNLHLQRKLIYGPWRDIWAKH
jgi:hypothetical protein